MSKISFKLFLLCFIFSIGVQADSIKERLISEISLSADGSEFINIENIKVKQFFQKRQKRLLLKIKINKQVLQDKIYYIRLSTTKEHVVSSNVSLIYKNNFPVIKINKNETILISLDFKKSIPLFDLSILSENEFKYILPHQDTLFGLAYGIIFCAFLYNFVFFLYNKEKSLMYYSLLQFFLLITLFVLSSNIIVVDISSSYPYFFEIFLNILINLTYILCILFNMSFLNTKKYSPKIHKILNALLFLCFTDIFSTLLFNRSFFDEHQPDLIFILILLASAFVVLKAGYKPATFYIVSWFSLFVFIFLSETNFSDINDVYLLHIGIPLESLLFSFALGYKMQQKEIERQKNETILITQSKLASMGEMIGNIAHQWRQPLTHLSYILMNMKAAHENDKLTKAYFKNKSEEANKQIEFMSHTIEDFRNFFKVSKQKESFCVVQCINESINLLKESFKSLGIDIEFKHQDTLTVKTYRGELLQVIFNILNNAKEEFVRREIKSPKILITIKEKEKNIVIKISDNAKGIDEKILEKIFEPYFTTKEKGLGIGLYMSKMIMDNNIGGKLEVENIKNGVEFKITLYNSKSLCS